eukprot:scaffold69999_cov48-Phaeocystis_antarctica.AAC.1
MTNCARSVPPRRGCSPKLGNGSLENLQTTVLSFWSPTARAVWSWSQEVRDPQRWHVVCRGSGARSLAVSVTARSSIGVVIMPSYSQSPTDD